MCLLRAYPYGFGSRLVELFKTRAPVADLRGKPKISACDSDRAVFEQLPLGDCWWDADLPGLFAYLWQNKRLKVPDSWSETMHAFSNELSNDFRWQWLGVGIFDAF